MSEHQPPPAIFGHCPACKLGMIWLRFGGADPTLSARQNGGALLWRGECRCGAWVTLSCRPPVRALAGEAGRAADAA